jgi:uncharacterized damage-inducible protein DinB
MPSTRDTLITDLRASGDETIRLLESVPESRYAEGRYENGWNARQILAHLAAIEWTYPRLFDLATAAPAAGSGELATATIRDGMDGYNARQVEKRADTPVPDLIAEFAGNREALIARVQSADESLFERPIQSAGGRQGTLAQVLREVALEHVRQHARDIAGG